MKKLLLSSLIFVSGVLLIGQPVKFSREKQILILHNVDSLLRDYEFYCTISEGIKITENQKDKFLTLFRDTSVIVFDDICPNYINNNESTINEKNKTISDYTKDISSSYQYLYCRILETDAGSLYSRLVLDKDGLSVSVKIRKELNASTKDSLSAIYKTHTDQTLVLRIADTILCKPLINEIVKSGVSKWEYVPPPSKPHRWEKLFSIITNITNIKYNNPNSDLFITGPKTNPKIGFGIEGAFRYLIKNMESNSRGLSFGLQISYLNSLYSASNYIRADLTNDVDNDSYYNIRDLKSLKENQSILGVGLPISIDYEKRLSYNNGFYIKAGGIFSFYTGSYKYNTDYEISGYYPQYNWFLQNYSDLGFVSGTNYSNHGSLPVNPFNVSGNIELGMYFSLKNNYQLYIGMNYSQAFLNASLNENKSNQLAKDPVFNSLMSEMGNVNLSVIGIKIGIKKIFTQVYKQKTVNYLKQMN